MTDEPAEKTMSFWDHLEELRRRIFAALLAFAVGAVVAWIYREQLLLWITEPFIGAWHEQGLGERAQLHFAAPAALFFAYLRIAGLGGLVLSMPFILYQLWAFIAPGLYRRERRLALPFVASATALFIGGAYFGWRVAVPVAFGYLLHFAGVLDSRFEVRPTVMIDDYLEFVTRLLLGFGVAFQLPVLVFFLSITGMVTYVHLLRFARYFIVVAFVLAAVLTPPDIYSQLLLAIPLCVLYGVSIGVAYLFGRRPASPDPTPSSDAPSSDAKSSARRR